MTPRPSLLAALALSLACAAPASARPRGDAAVEVSLDIGGLDLDVSRMHFTGEGTPAGFHAAEVHVDATGGALGLHAVRFYHADVRMFLPLWRHLLVGGYLGYLWGDPSPTRDDLPSGPIVEGDRIFSGIQLAHTISGADLGLDAALIGSIGPVSLRAELLGGLRTFGVAMTNFEKISCGKGGHCYPTISHTQAYLQPRAAASVTLGWFTVGAYVGGDVAPQRALTVGGFVGLSPNLLKRTQIFE